MKKVSCVILAIFVVVLAGCGAPDISAYRDEQIKVTGLLEEDFYITPGELAELDCVTDVGVGQTEKAGTIKAYGPTLDTFLESYGKTVDDFKSIKFHAGDDYSMTLGKVTWDNYTVILSIGRGSSPLEEYERPLRVVIPGGDSGKWIRFVTEIEFTYAE